MAEEGGCRLSSLLVACRHPGDGRDIPCGNGLELAAPVVNNGTTTALIFKREKK
jgi:hypothetical protein